MRYSKSSFNREVHSDTVLPQETRHISNKIIILLPVKLEEEEQTKPKVSIRKENTKIRMEIK